MAGLYGVMSVPGSELGLGSSLQTQLADETEEERRRRKLGLSADKLLGPGASAPAKALGLGVNGTTYGSLGGGAMGSLGGYARR
jgi:hypothetical protein